MNKQGLGLLVACVKIFILARPPPLLPELPETATLSAKHLVKEDILILTDAHSKSGSAQGRGGEGLPGALRMARMGHPGRDGNPDLLYPKPRLSFFRNDADLFKSTGVFCPVATADFHF